MSFAHLHCHSERSVLDAILKTPEAVARAVTLEQEALAITDHGTMAGIVTHYQECKKAGIVPILGVEAYLVEDAQSHPQYAKDLAAQKNQVARDEGIRKQVTTSQSEAAKLRRHCLLWADDFEGYQVLCRAMTKAFGQMHYKPLLDHSDLAKIGQSGKVWMSTGCVSSHIPRLVRESQYDAAEDHLRWLIDIFRDKLVVEVQKHGLDDVNEELINHWLVARAQKLSLPVIATQDVHYTLAEDQDIHSFYKRMTHGQPYQGEGYHLTSAEEVRTVFPQWWDRITEGISHVVDSCRKITFPALDSYSYQVPEVTSGDPVAELVQLTFPKVRELGPEYVDRFQTEMKVIRSTGFAQYFLFVHQIVQFCDEQDIFVLARGSASGSLICWALGITQLDPLKYKLLFERFLSNDRSKPPDIDLDVQDDRRDEVLAYIARRFETTQIGTILTYADRSVRNEVLAQLREDHAELVSEVDEVVLDLPIAKTLLERLTGVTKSIGGHAAGVVAETPGRSVRDLVPLHYISSSERWVTQYSMDDIETLGFVKVDILGVRALRTLTVILEHIGGGFSRDDIPPSDAATWKLLGKGATDGIFTFKGWSNKKGCQLLKPKSLDDCSLVAAMWRPSCLEMGLEKLFLERRAAKWQMPADWHPSLQPLAETYGVAVYQEQVIQIMRDLSFTPDDVMVMLRAVKKKDPKLMAQVRARLEEIIPDQDLVEQVWELMDGYTRYGFNRSHSLAYAKLGYEMAYLRANYPLEFWAGLLETETEKTVQQTYLRLARQDCKVLPVSATDSGATWTIEKGSLRRGLTSVPGVGEKAARALVEARPFASLRELREKINGVACNKRTLGLLAKAGAFRTMGYEDEEELAVKLEEIDLEQKAEYRAMKQQQKAKK